MEELRKILGIYFDLTGRPQGKKLMDGKLSLINYCKLVEANAIHNINRYEKIISELKTIRHKPSWNKKLKEQKRILKLARKYMKELKK